MERAEVFAILCRILEKQGQTANIPESALLRGIGFKSLDFSELALRVELRIGRSLSFDAKRLRQLATVKDILDFFQEA